MHASHIPKPQPHAARAGNVLLTEDPERGASGGLRALVGDFGLARHLGGAEALQSNTYGTVDHQAPEVLRDGRIAKVLFQVKELGVRDLIF